MVSVLESTHSVHLRPGDTLAGEPFVSASYGSLRISLLDRTGIRTMIVDSFRVTPARRGSRRSGPAVVLPPPGGEPGIDPFQATWAELELFRLPEVCRQHHIDMVAGRLITSPTDPVPDPPCWSWEPTAIQGRRGTSGQRRPEISRRTPLVFPAVNPVFWMQIYWAGRISLRPGCTLRGVQAEAERLEMDALDGLTHESLVQSRPSRAGGVPEGPNRGVVCPGAAGVAPCASSRCPNQMESRS
jgi:hypothetical protein